VSVARRHHTVPQFYLRGFSRDDQLVTVRLPGEQRFLQSVRKTAAEMDFYSIDGHEDGPDVVEKAFASLEGETARVFGAIVGGAWPLPAADRELLALFVALQAARGPEQRRNMEYVAAQMTRLEIGFGGRYRVRDWVQRERGVEISEEDAALVWEQATRPEGPPIRLRPAAYVQQMLRLADETVKYIAGRPWTLVRLDRLSLFTCDTPVGLIPHPGEEVGAGVGFMTAWGVAYPLSRKLGLMMSDPMVLAKEGVPVELVRNGNFDRSEGESEQMQRAFNQITMGAASLWLYHHPDDAGVLPPHLPEPSPTTMEMSGAAFEFPVDASPRRSHRPGDDAPATD
jgi:hypothetical protein